MSLLTKDLLRFNRGRKAIDCRFLYFPAKFIERIALVVESLNNAHCAAVNRRTEEPRYCRISLVLNGQRQWRKSCFAIAFETRIKIFKSQQLLLSADSETQRPMPQFIPGVNVAKFTQPQRTGVR